MFWFYFIKENTRNKLGFYFKYILVVCIYGKWEWFLGWFYRKVIKISVLIFIYNKVDSSLKIFGYFLNVFYEGICKVEWGNLFFLKESFEIFFLRFILIYLFFIIFFIIIKIFYFDFLVLRLSFKNEELVGWLYKERRNVGEVVS